MEFGGFIGGFGKNFFTKEGIKREKWVLRRVGVWALGCVEERRLGWSFGGKGKGERVGFLGYIWRATIY